MRHQSIYQMMNTRRHNNMFNGGICTLRPCMFESVILHHVFMGTMVFSQGV
jgi:hypothetical protein